MDLGYIRVAAAVPHLKVADCKYNTKRIIYLINEAVKNDVQMIAFPELSITGYTCGDLFHQQLLIETAEDQLKEILDITHNTEIVIMVGIPVKADNQLFNCVVVLQGGKILAAIPKTYIPNYSEFYEKRWFASSANAVSDSICLCNQVVPFHTNILFKDRDVCFGIDVCEDLWVPIPPSSFHCLHGANIIFNLSASNEVIGKNEYRKSLVMQQSARCMSGYIYVSAGGGESTTDVVFAGHALITENGSALAESQRFSQEEQLIISEIDVDRLNADRQKSTSFMGLMGSHDNLNKHYQYIPFRLKKSTFTHILRTVDPYPFVPQNDLERDQRCEEIFSIQVSGLLKRISHTGSKCAVIGISGGLDSTLALLVAVRTFDALNMPRKNIIGITMPGFGTTGRTYNNALDLMKSLGVTIKEINIKDACMQHFKDIEHNPEKHDVTYENTQARERTQILMDIANKENGLVIGTGDLSELALGWATYNGDHMSMYAVNSGVPKTLVRFLVKWVAENLVNERSKNTLLDILDTPVSPELLPANDKGEIDQKTEDIVGPYELHDFFLYNLVRFGFRPAKIYFLAQTAFSGKYPAEVIKKWLKIFYRRFFTQQFKRSCLPDGPKVGSINLSPRGDWRMPSDASYRLWMDEVEDL
ncbi:NAD(+) synthase [Petroclostridium sp. X23]|uniref:NAD(+) synthase n=1 Tax=Petroclostridium sp. X23 TaxID=3045146 RepID=UPI0024AD548E|nr:NAD(+) synthase [Petroclostridium sp. X23]WHH61770.1 NAD(+) synthase [Petroclostridium sp. X23]